MDRPPCKTCPHFDQYSPKRPLGRCLRFPPQVVTPDEGRTTPWNPEVDDSESCGEHPEFHYYAAAFAQALKDAQK